METKFCGEQNLFYRIKIKKPWNQLSGHQVLRVVKFIFLAPYPPVLVPGIAVVLVHFFQRHH